MSVFASDAERKAFWAKLRRKNPSEFERLNKKWHEAHREKVLEHQKKWHEENPEKEAARLKKGQWQAFVGQQKAKTLSTVVPGMLAFLC